MSETRLYQQLAGSLRGSGERLAQLLRARTTSGFPTRVKNGRLQKLRPSKGGGARQGGKDAARIARYLEQGYSPRAAAELAKSYEGNLITFQSSSFPASRAGHPDSSELEASGVELLTRILDAIQGDAITLQGPPVAEGSGCTDIVVLRGTNVAVHLTWYPAGPPGAQQRDLWTLQTGPSGWLCRLLPSGRRRSDEAAHDVMALVERALEARPAEFSEVRRCAWRDLER